MPLTLGVVVVQAVSKHLGATLARQLDRFGGKATNRASKLQLTVSPTVAARKSSDAYAMRSTDDDIVRNAPQVLYIRHCNELRTSNTKVKLMQMSFCQSSCVHV